jgi:mono/diheme cytochrome c family protein
MKVPRESTPGRFKPGAAMKKLASAIVFAASLGSVTLATHAATPDAAKAAMGRSSFRSLCTSCHGPGAKGDGPVAPYLSPKPPDLTLISSRHNGVFPAERVAKIIDGRETVAGHGNKDMPVWGKSFAQLDDVKSNEDVATKVLELTEYLRSIQK